MRRRGICRRKCADVPPYKLLLLLPLLLLPLLLLLLLLPLPMLLS